VVDLFKVTGDAGRRAREGMQEGRREIKYWAHENDAGGVDPFKPARR